MTQLFLDIDPSFQHLLDEVKDDEDIIAIVIFGSYARNETYRDIDICLIDYPRKITASKELKYRTSYPELFDIHFFSKLPLYIQYEVVNEGILAFDKDYDILFDLYLDTIRNYGLFAPHFEVFLGGE